MNGVTEVVPSGPSTWAVSLCSFATGFCDDAANVCEQNADNLSGQSPYDEINSGRSIAFLPNKEEPHKMTMQEVTMDQRTMVSKMQSDSLCDIGTVKR